MTDSTTDRTYLVDVRAMGTGFKTYEVEAPSVVMAMHYACSMAAKDASVNARHTYAVDARLKPLPQIVCASCGEPEGSEYAKYCCTADNMIEY